MDVAATIQIGAGAAGSPARGAAAPGFGIQVKGSARNRLPASGDSGDARFQSGWKNFLEALGAVSAGPAAGDAGSKTPSLSSSPTATQSRDVDTAGMVQALTPKPGPEQPNGFGVEREVDFAGRFAAKKPMVSNHTSPAKDIDRPHERRTREVSDAESSLMGPRHTSGPELQAGVVEALVPEQRQSAPAPHAEGKHPAAGVETSAVELDSVSRTNTKENATFRGSLQSSPIRPKVEDSSIGGIASDVNPVSNDTKGAAPDSHVNQNLRGSPVPTELDPVEPGREKRGASSTIGDSTRTLTQPARIVTPFAVALRPDNETATNSLRNVGSMDSTAGRNMLKTAHAGGTHEIEGEGRVISQKQPGLAAQATTSPSILRDTAAIAAMNEGQRSTGITAHGLSADRNGLAGNDTFAALDAGRDALAPTWIHAGTHHAEAGYLDPALGWVGVRADAVGGGVHAALMPGSNEAAQVLGSHLAGLNNYLAEHHGQHATVTLATAQDGRGAPSADQGSGSGEGNAGRGGADEGHDDVDSSRTRSGSDMAFRAVAAAPVVTTADMPVYGTRGDHISVMA
jgi:hypothetical protein